MIALTKDLFEAIRERRSERHLKSDPVPDYIVGRIVECGLKVPSARNMQPWQLLIVKRPELKADLSNAVFGQKFIEDAPVVIV